MRAKPLLSALLAAAVTAATPGAAGELCVASTANDLRVASAVWQELSARHRKATPSSQKALRGGIRPGCRGDVTLDIYGVVEPEEFKVVEVLAREAQAAVPGTATVSLRFFEREVWVATEGGGGYRGKERLLKRVTLPKPHAGPHKREG
jgi:hypothetical protein